MRRPRPTRGLSRQEKKKVIPTAMLFLLEGVYQLYISKKKHKHAQIYLFLTIT